MITIESVTRTNGDSTAVGDGLLTHADLLGLVAGHERDYGHRSAEAIAAALAGTGGVSNEVR